MCERPAEVVRVPPRVVVPGRRPGATPAGGVLAYLQVGAHQAAVDELRRRGVALTGDASDGEG